MPIPSPLEGFRWQDFVDIALNSYILFRLYMLFRGTNVFRVITGIALLWVIQRVAIYMGLIVTSWLLQGVIAVAALIIIIVFRNEIRSVLQAKNLKAILWGNPVRVDQAHETVIAEALFELAEEKQGALVVFPREENLEDYLQSGVRVEARISRELLKSLFWYGSPLHDGAAVLRGNQIVKAGVILPLTQQSDLPSHYGTRHRAALGLSEATDAVIVVVSEERGDVSVALGGNMIEIENRMALADLIHSHFGRPHDRMANQRRETVRYWGALMVSVVFVTGIWLSFSRGLESLVNLEVPIEYMNRDPGMEILDASVDEVQLRLGGSGSLIRNLRPDQVKVRLDLSTAIAGKNVFTIGNDHITLPPGIFLKKVEPSTVEVTLDVPVAKELPIQVDWVGRLDPNLVLESVTLTPEKTKVIGGHRILSQIHTLYTEAVPLEKIEDSGSMTLRLALTPASLRVAPNAADKVVIHYQVAARERRAPVEDN